MPAGLVAWLEPLIIAIARAVARELVTMSYVRTQEAPDEKDRQLGRDVFDLVRRVPPAPPPGKP